MSKDKPTRVVQCSKFQGFKALWHFPQSLIDYMSALCQQQQTLCQLQKRKQINAILQANK